MAVERDKILKTLETVISPLHGQDIVTAGLVKALVIDKDSVRFVIEIETDQAEHMESVRLAAEEALVCVPGVNSALVVMTAHSASSSRAGQHSESAHTQTAMKPSRHIPDISRIIAIASGKGGVGKSTVSANLATALAAAGCRVGLLDADIYGPSQPRMLGVSGRPSSPDGKIILPLRNHGVTVMSIGLMTDERQSIVWRGPMLMNALKQMISQVQWGELDILLIDLPPGTGDVQLTLAQNGTLDSAVIVSTPQDIALLDARKAIDMFNKLHIPIIGMIENMSGHVCSQCGHNDPIFGHGGVAKEARDLNVPLLGEIPLHHSIRHTSDEGVPVVISKPNSPEAQAFCLIAETLINMEKA